ncbi:MAG: TspO/MBR family protein, partial [Parcubacteria group bacterium]
MTKTKKVIGCVIAILICELAGMIGSIFTTPSIAAWYSTIHKAPFNPPNWIFGPVWTILFVLMGVALYLVWQSEKSEKGAKKIAIMFFALQLCLNVLWSILFFGAHSPFAAFVEILALWL